MPRNTHLSRPPSSALPRGQMVLRPRNLAVSLRVTRKSLYLNLALISALVILLFLSLLIGKYTVSLPELAATLQGNAPSRPTHFFIMERRLPRALVAMLVGAAFAVSGAIFQSTTRNPLASPDIIGVSSGASAGAVFVLLVLNGSTVQVGVGAFSGAVFAAGAIALLAGRRGLQGMRVVLFGVALGALASAAISYILTQVFVASAVTAQVWLVGSLQGSGWSDLLFIAATLFLVIPILWHFSSRLEILGMGDELAVTLGVNAEMTRRALLLVATVLVAAAVATSGPISFVALAAPHIARRLGGSAALFPAALTGALLLGSSDLIAQQVFAHPIPVGVVTVVVGGGFFLWLLIREGNKRAD